MPSFDSVNYSVRLKKNVERKIIGELMLRLNPAFSIGSYQYIGMGSLWFSDFVLMHKFLGIKKMYSVERDSPLRAKFNSPYGFVEVLEGTVSENVPSLLSDDQRSVVWLDYDGDLRHKIVRDLLDIVPNARAGDIFIVTSNAHIGQVRPPSYGDLAALSRKLDDILPEIDLTGLTVEVPKDHIGPLIKQILSKISDANARDGVAQKNTILRNLIERVMPCNFSGDDFTEQKFPGLVSMALLAAMDSACTSTGLPLRFAPLFNFQYCDGAPMVTVGGMIADDACVEKLHNLKHMDIQETINGNQQLSINVPNLTPKEKTLIDSLLTRDGQIPSMDQIGFELEETALENYCTFYRQYPQFNEIV